MALPQSPDDFELFERALSAVGEAASLEGLRSEFFRLRDSYGLINVAYHVVSIPWQAVENPILVLTYDEAWVRRYLERDYFRIDPVVRSGRGGFLPIDWADVDHHSVEAG